MNTRSGPAWWREPVQVPAYEGKASADAGADGVLAFWALIVFTFILLLAPQQRFPVLAPLRIALLAAAVAVGAYVISRLAKGLPLIDWTPAMVLVASLVAWAVVMVPLSSWPGGSVTYLLDHYFKTLIVFVLLAHVINSLSRLQQISWTLVLLSVPLALTTIENYVSGLSFADSTRVIGYSSALTTNPNDMALMLNLILPMGIGLFLAERRVHVRLLLGCIMPLLVLAIIVTFSRAGFLTLGLTGMCYLWLLRDRPERVWPPVLLMLSLIGIPLLPDSYIDRIMTIVEIEEDTTGSAQTRLGDIKVAVEVVIDHPVIGAGPGMNILAMNKARGETWTEVHNVYLQYAVELGLPGLVLFLLFYRKCLAAVRTVMQRTRGKPQYYSLYCLTEGVQVSLMAFALAAMFHPVAYSFYFYYMAGLALAVQRIWAGQQQQLQKQHQLLKRAPTPAINGADLS